jgi:hypothetical protein
MTAVPATLDALLAVVSEDAGFAGVRVFDGSWIDRPSEPDVIVIGWLAPDGQPPVVFAENPLLGSSESTFTVRGLVSSWTGDEDMPGVRARADALLETLRVALRADPSLGEVVTSASLQAARFTPLRSEQGCEALWDFTIQVNASSHP